MIDLPNIFDVEFSDSLLYDCRLDRISSKKVPVDETMKILGMIETLYFGYSVRHFHDALLSDHGFSRRYNCLRLKLQSGRLVRPAPRCGAHRSKWPCRPHARMMLHQNASRHSRVPEIRRNLVVRMHDAASEIFSARFVDEEETMSTFRSIEDTISSKGLFCSLYVDRSSHCWHTPEAGEKINKAYPTQVDCPLHDLGIQLIAKHSPQARGSSERKFGTSELPTAGASPERDCDDGGGEPLSSGVEFSEAQRAVFASRRGEDTAFVPFRGDLSVHLCVQVDRMIGKENTVHYKGRTLQISENSIATTMLRVNVRVREYPDERLAVIHGPRCIGRYESYGAALPAEA